MKIKTSNNKFQGQAWFEFWISTFWRYPNRLFALKASISMGLLLIPFLILGASFIGVTLALGALAGALSETDDHPKGRIKALLLTIISFAISSTSVELLRPFPILFGVGLVGSTITFIILGGLGERYRGITFGALLVAIYTMLGADLSPNWYWQPLLLPAGALCYGLISLLLLISKPSRLLEEQLSQAFEDLSVYIKEKSRLFPSDTKVQHKLRNRLATLNSKLVNSIEGCKNVLNSYENAMESNEALRPYLHKFLLLQSLHERAASSHDRYDLLSDDPENREILEGLGQLLLQLSRACHEVSKSLIMGTVYHHPIALKWTVSALRDKVKKQHANGKYSSLSLLLQNLTQSHLSLKNMNYYVDTGILPRIDRDSRPLWQRFKEQLNWNHPRLRYAVRLSSCFLLGYILITQLNIAKGEWILLTSLFVCQPSYSETRRRLFQRILGTLTGVVIGVAIVQILPTTAGQIVLLLAAAYAFFAWLRKNYSISVIFVTIFVIAAFNLLAGKGVAVMGPRILDTLIGAILAIGVVRFLWPDWQHKKLPQLLANALQQNSNYFKSILAAYKGTKEDDLDYRISRYRAHQADSALALAWQGMKLEPKRQQKFQKHAFTLTYLNHALLSYLSALGAHRNLKNYVDEKQWQMYNKIGAELINAIAAIENKTECSSSVGIKIFIEELGHQLSEMEKGNERLKLVLLYNIAEVSEQLLEEACSLSKD